jgi:hypothetical protein
VVGEEVRVVEGALTDATLVVHQRPRVAAVVAAEEAAVVVLDERVDAIRISRRHGDTDASHEPLGGQALVAGELRPVSPPSVLLNSPLPGPPLDIWYSLRYASHSAAYMTSGLLRSIAMSTAPVFASRKRTLRHVAAVGALEHAALLARHAVLAEGGGVDDVRVGGVDADLRDRVDRLEADVLPRSCPRRRSGRRRRPA